MKGLKCFFILLFLGLIPLGAFGQRTADSLRFKALLDSARELYAQRDFQASISVSNALIQEAQDKGFPFFEIGGYLNLSSTHFQMREDAVALDELRLSLDLAMNNKLYTSAIVATSQLGLFYFNLSQYDSAEQAYLKSARIARDYVPERHASTLVNVGWIYGLMNNREKELEGYLNALKAVEANPDSYKAAGVKAMAYSGLGDYYSFIKEYDLAEAYFEKKLALAKEQNSVRMEYEAHTGLASIYRSDERYDFEKSKQHYELIASNDDPGLAHYKYQATMGLAKLYKKAGLFDQSLQYFSEVEAFYGGLSAKDFQSSAQAEMGELYLQQGRLKDARNWLVKALALARERNLLSREREALRSLYKVDSLQGRYKSALSGYQRLEQIEDSMSSERSQNRIKELQIQYETEQTAKENLALKSNLELKEAQMQRQSIVQVFIAVVALAVISLTLVIYRNYRRKKRDHETISAQAASLEELSRFKQGLTSMVVHDMRNPINGIIGFSQGTPTEKKLRSINQSGHKVLNLVNNMLDIQRFEEAQVELEEEVFAWRDLVSETLNDVHLLSQARSVRIENTVPKDLRVRADKGLMSRVLINLLSNAIKFSKAGGKVFVEIGAVMTDQVDLIIRDTGSGIAPEQLPYIFDKFWHNDYSKTGILPSTGLGLAFCKLAVEAHGGQIRAESDPETGTSMIFTMPKVGELALDATPAENGAAADEGALSSPDVDILRLFLPDLSLLKIHEVSAINKLMRDIEQRGVDRKWREDLQSAVYQGDQERYDALLALAKG